VHVYVVRVTNPNLPTALYLPTGVQSDEDTGTAIELRRTEDGRTALVAYSTLDRLIDGCGEHQPWVLVSTRYLPKIHQAHPYDLIVLDSPLPQGMRHTSALV
jgi:hypothetical protein